MDESGGIGRQLSLVVRVDSVRDISDLKDCEYDSPDLVDLFLSETNVAHASECQLTPCLIVDAINRVGTGLTLKELEARRVRSIDSVL